MPKYRYRGNPGYTFEFESGDATVSPGDVVDLTAEEAASVGDDFEPVAKSKADKATTESAGDGEEG